MSPGGFCQPGEQWAENNARVDRLIYTLVQKKELTVSEEDLEAQIQAAGNAFAIDMLAAKFIQGLPVVGVFGGLSNPGLLEAGHDLCAVKI